MSFFNMMQGKVFLFRGLDIIFFYRLNKKIETAVAENLFSTCNHY